MKILLLLLLAILQLNASLSKKTIIKQFRPFLKLDLLSKVKKFPQIAKLLKEVNTPQKKIAQARKAFLTNTPRARKTFLTLLQSYLRPLSQKEFYGFLALDLVGYTLINHKLDDMKITKLKTQLQSLKKQTQQQEMKEYQANLQLMSSVGELQRRLEEFESQVDSGVSNLNTFASLHTGSLI